MPIDQKQREKNTFNKRGHIAKGTYDHPLTDHYAKQSRKQGKIGSGIVGVARSLAMDNDTDSTDYTGGPEEHQEANDYLKKHARMSEYGGGHNMSHHGEGREYGK